jgi:hypothetical protein
VAGCCECGDEPSGSCTTELVSLVSYVHLLYVVQSKNSWTCLDISSLLLLTVLDAQGEGECFESACGSRCKK